MGQKKRTMQFLKRPWFAIFGRILGKKSLLKWILSWSLLSSPFIIFPTRTSSGLPIIVCNNHFIWDPTWTLHHTQEEQFIIPITCVMSNSLTLRHSGFFTLTSKHGKLMSARSCMSSKAHIFTKGYDWGWFVGQFTTIAVRLDVLFVALLRTKHLSSFHYTKVGKKFLEKNKKHQPKKSIRYPKWMFFLRLWLVFKKIGCSFLNIGCLFYIVGCNILA